MPRYRSGQTEQSVKRLAEASIGSNPILGTRRGERVLMLILGTRRGERVLMLILGTRRGERVLMLILGTIYIIVIAGLGSSVVERLHGKEEVGSSILPPGSSGTVVPFKIWRFFSRRMLVDQ